MLKISAIIITYNEERNIERCLESVIRVADEVIIVDSGSTDKTVEICKKYNAKVFFNPFIDYSKQKNFALDQTLYNYVLSLDADEVLSEALIKKIEDLKREGFSADGYMIKRQNIAFGLMPKHFWEYQLRLFNKTKGRFVDLPVHEYVKVDGKVKKIEEPILHYTYNSVTEQITKLNRYSELEANQRIRGTNFSNIYLKPLYTLFILLFRKGLILDGIQGIHFAIVMAFYVYLVEFRVWLNGNVKKGL